MSKLTADDVDIVSRKVEFKSYVQVDSYRLKHTLFDGGKSSEIRREVLERGHAAAVLLYDPDLDVLVMIEQFRPGAFVALQSGRMPNEETPWLIECVAGIIEDGESPEDVVRREAIEEANCVVTELVPLFHYYSSPGCMSESIFLYCGRVDGSDAEGIHGLDGEGEDIRVFTLSPDQAAEGLASGRINNSMTMIALQWFQVNRQDLRAKWLEPVYINPGH